ncbi:site-specific integrase [Dyadobacter sp. CY347]|uniref:tyrosine-type recombinase/integrase n=1 Tax=Dyadobacter sp. CY347 TaxID=2909336 RepID=UPI001F2DE100|nr:site-specific integrase [Dyadobacter sp. CY347]MCF2491128.1 tyrosine-type recombinase/integrase [Dyadobacter sp. CY347]
MSVRFTKPFFESLPLPSKGRRYFHDDKEKGLSVYQTANGVISFYTRKRVKGKDARVFIGQYPDISIENARRKTAELKGLIATGKDPHEEKQVEKRNSQTFGNLFDEYMTRYSKKHKKSWKYDEREINKFLAQWFNKRLTSINRLDVQVLHEKIHHNSGLYQANRILERIKGMYNKAIEWGWQGQNPTIGIKKYKEKSRDRFVQPSEMPCLIQSLNEEENTTVKDFFWLLLLTGCRKTNTLMMRWDQINWEKSEWRIPDSKNGEPLFIPLTERAFEILKFRYSSSESAWVFPQELDNEKHFADPKKGWKRTLQRATFYLWLRHEKIGDWLLGIRDELPHLSPQMLFKEAVERAKRERLELPAGLLDIRMHDIRRTFGSYQAITGASLQVIGKSLGHKSTQATQIYARLNLDSVRGSVEKATEAMFQATELLPK